MGSLQGVSSADVISIAPSSPLQAAGYSAKQIKMNVLRGEIYLASFEFAHIKESKLRPVLILQCNEDNQNSHYPFVVAAPITTKKIDKIYKQDIFLSKEASNLEKDSKVLLGAMSVVTKSSLTKHIGKVSENIMKEVDLKLVRLLELLEVG